MENTATINKSNRIYYIDFLKFIGLIGIIIAHVNSPEWALMIRSFDVPLMVILSSILAGKTYSKYSGTLSSAANYYTSRIKRLVIPTWLFLVFYFAVDFLFTGTANSMVYYAASFCLTRYGIGYVWIILIYLYSALLIPLFYKLKLSVKGIVFVALSYLLFEIAYHYSIGLNINTVVNAFVDTTYYYIVPYGVLTYLGINYSRMNKTAKITITAVSALLFVSLAVFYWKSTGEFQSVYIAKYPPRMYFLSYGVAYSFGLLMLCEGKNLKIFKNKLVQYISSHSMWIYLWHILVLKVYEVLKLPEFWIIKFIIVCLVSVLIVMVINKLLDFADNKYTYPFVKYFRG